MNTLVAALMAWIVAHSSLGVAPAPNIQFVPKQEMSRLYRSAANEANFYQVEAFYLPPTATIYLPQAWSADDLRDRSVLVHELVHHLQAANNIKVGCPAALERQAYAMQVDWLHDQGIAEPHAFAGLDILTVIIAGSCPE